MYKILNLEVKNYCLINKLEETNNTLVSIRNPWKLEIFCFFSSGVSFFIYDLFSKLRFKKKNSKIKKT